MLEVLPRIPTPPTGRTIWCGVRLPRYLYPQRTRPRCWSDFVTLPVQEHKYAAAYRGSTSTSAILDEQLLWHLSGTDRCSYGVRYPGSHGPSAVNVAEAVPVRQHHFRRSLLQIISLKVTTDVRVEVTAAFALSVSVIAISITRMHRCSHHSRVPSSKNPLPPTTPSRQISS